MRVRSEWGLVRMWLGRAALAVRTRGTRWNTCGTIGRVTGGRGGHRTAGIAGRQHGTGARWSIGCRCIPGLDRHRCHHSWFAWGEVAHPPIVAFPLLDSAYRSASIGAANQNKSEKKGSKSHDQRWSRAKEQHGSKPVRVFLRKGRAIRFCSLFRRFCSSPTRSAIGTIDSKRKCGSVGTSCLCDDLHLTSRPSRMEASISKIPNHDDSAASLVVVPIRKP